ncbi:hypothetical protein [Neorhizobium sp. LjRoot104]|uniref:hypothetical protein n=1 Tax=Neorhizobium sp. LjRoot104 TaxID=3342254 RepID=UPI003ECEDF47
MDYYQGVVADYLRADRSVFLNTEFCLQVNDAPNPDLSGPHWYVDILAIDMELQAIFLCEITYSQSLSGLVKRLKAWQENWASIPPALHRDASLPFWPVRPWVFIPDALIPSLKRQLTLASTEDEDGMPAPVITPLEDTQPWNYRSWDRKKAITG